MDNKLKVINYLAKHTEKAYTMHELSKQLAIPYASFYRTIHAMKDILHIHPIGKAKTLTLNKQNPTLKAYLTIASDEEKKEFLEKQPMIKKIAGELETDNVVVLFGSYAKGKQTEKSDVDILIINKDRKKSISFAKYEVIFKKKINPLFVTKEEFKKMLQEKEENVGKQVLKEHIILNNPEVFWEYILNAIQ